jgi:hypothetical protein
MRTAAPVCGGLKREGERDREGEGERQREGEREPEKETQTQIEGEMSQISCPRKESCG